MYAPMFRLDNALGILKWVNERGVHYSLAPDGTARRTVSPTVSLTRWGRETLSLVEPAILMAVRIQAGRCVACGVNRTTRHTPCCYDCLLAKIRDYPCYRSKHNAKNRADDNPPLNENADLNLFE